MTSSTNPLQQRHKHLLGHRIADGRLELVSILGLGAYGVVYLARDLSHPLHKDQSFASSSSSDFAEMPHLLASQHGGAASGYYAVKCLNKVDLDNRQKKFQRREIVLHSMVTSHPSVVSLYRVIDNKGDPCIYVIMDYCPDGDLFSMITENQRYAVHASESEDVDSDYDQEYQLARSEMDIMVKSVFTQILDAVHFCHVNGIYHRDLKPENILCLQGGAKVVLADFGLATHEKESNDFGCGSTFYMGPECQGGISSNLKKYSTAANDIWSLGVILVNLICGRNPWKQACFDDETFREYLRNPDFLMDILPISQETNSMLKRIFTVNEDWRCSLVELRAMVKQNSRFTATNAELRDRQKVARQAAQLAKEEAARARAAAEAARREAEIRHNVDYFYHGVSQEQQLQAELCVDDDEVTPEQMQDASEAISQSWPYEEDTVYDEESSFSDESVDDTAQHDNNIPSTPCKRRVDTIATTPASSYSPASYKSSEAGSLLNSPLESDSEMTPDNSSSRSGSGACEIRTSYTGLPPTPSFDPQQKQQSRMDIDCGLESLAIQSLTGNRETSSNTAPIYYAADDTAANVDPNMSMLFLPHRQQKEQQQSNTQFSSVPSRRGGAAKSKVSPLNTRILRNTLFGA
jgi:serine/threonine protein kinase